MRTAALLLVALLALPACKGDPPETTLDGPTEPAIEEALAEGTLEAPRPGAQAPAFTLTGTDGEAYTLDDFRGQTVVLEWLNYGCPYVGKHYGGGAMQALQARAAEDGVVWLSVVSSAPGEQGHYEPAAMDAETAARGGRQRAVLLDPTGEVGRRYDAQTTPHMFVIGPDGAVVYNGAIDDRPSTDAASLDGATGYVLPAIAAAQAGEPADPATTPPYGCSVKYAEGA